MAKEPIEIIKAQLGNMVVEIAMLNSELEKRNEKIVELEAKLPKEEK